MQGVVGAALVAAVLGAGAEESVDMLDTRPCC
jgi:hypothetical protein